jgi:hypothetical protein
MDFFDFLWNVDQERQLKELRGRLDQARLEHDLAGGDRKVKELAEENVELKLRLGLLVRLLITKGVITAEEYARLIAETRHQVVVALPGARLLLARQPSRGSSLGFHGPQYRTDRPSPAKNSSAC